MLVLTLAVKGNKVHSSEIEEKLSKLDGRGSEAEYDAVKSLAALGQELPELLLQKYRRSKRWGERASCVYHAIEFAKNNDSAYQLGIEATQDRSKYVRYRACMLLAIAQKQEAITSLEVLLQNKDSVDDAKASIDAIKHQNQNYFVDRDHSDMVTLNV